MVLFTKITALTFCLGLINQDGYIDYNEFVAMMQNTEFGKKKIQNSASIGLRDAFKGGST